MEKISAKRAAANKNSANASGTPNNNESSTPNKKFCILVTQSIPLLQPWVSPNSEQVMKNLKSSGIKLSIVSAHKLSELYQLYESCGGDLSTATLKNYATKPHHLVLLSGFTLPEHDNPPIVASTANASTQPTQQQPQQQQASPAGSHMIPSSQPQQQIPNVADSPASQQQQQQQPQQQQQMTQQPQMAQQQNMGGQQLRPVNSMAQQNPNMVRPWPGTMNQQQQDPSQMQQKPQQQQMPQPGMAQQPGNQATHQPGPQPGLSVPGNQQSQHLVVWQGTLELHDKKDGKNIFFFLSPMISINSM